MPPQDQRATEACPHLWGRAEADLLKVPVVLRAWPPSSADQVHGSSVVYGQGHGGHALFLGVQVKAGVQDFLVV